MQRLFVTKGSGIDRHQLHGLGVRVVLLQPPERDAALDVGERGPEGRHVDRVCVADLDREAGGEGRSGNVRAAGFKRES